MYALHAQVGGVRGALQFGAAVIKWKSERVQRPPTGAEFSLTGGETGMQVIQQTRTSVNVSGYVDRLEHGIVRKHLEVQLEHVKEPVYVQRPIIG